MRHYTKASSRKKKKIKAAAAATAAANPGNNELHTLVRARLPFPYSSRALLPFALLCLAWVRSLQPPSRKRTQKRTKQSKQTVSSYWFKKIKLGEPAVPPTAPHPSPPHFTPPPPPLRSPPCALYSFLLPLCICHVRFFYYYPMKICDVAKILSRFSRLLPYPQLPPHPPQPPKLLMFDTN